MATNFSQVSLTQDKGTGEWEFTPRISNKRRRHATSQSSNNSPDEFGNASNRTKLTMILEEISEVKAGQETLHELLVNTNQQLTSRCDPITGILNQQSALLKTLAYKSIDIEARSRRNNLIFRGLKELQYENCAHVVLDFLGNIVQLDTRGMVITRAHRLGVYKKGHRYARPIIVNFMNYNDVEVIMANAKTLKYVPGFSIYRDFPKEIDDARKRLWGVYKDTKKSNPNSNVRIVYPAKLVCGSRVIRDEFPDWHMFVHKSRIVEFPIVEFPVSESSSPETVAMDTAQPAPLVEKETGTDGTSIPKSPISSHSQRSESNNDVTSDTQQRNRESENVPSLFGAPVEVSDSQESTSVSSSANSQESGVSNSDKKGTHSSRSTRKPPAGRRRAQSASVHNCNRNKLPSTESGDVSDISGSVDRSVTAPRRQPSRAAEPNSG